MITMIAAVAKDRIIGAENKMPWHIPEDLAYFKEQTMGKSIVMGRKTFESIGRALPNRENIVLTSDTSFTYPGVKVFHHKKEVLKTCANQELMIIGGGQIYELFYPEADRLLITCIEQEVEGDTIFVDYTHDFRLVYESERKRDGKYTYCFTEWLRKNKETE